MSTLHALPTKLLVCAFAAAVGLIDVSFGWAAEGAPPSAPLTPGEEVFRDSCSVCHNIESGAPTIVAPNLFGIVGRRSATEQGFFYSAAMQEANLTWDAVTLSAFLTSPQQVVPGTSMGFTGFLDPGDTQNVIAYLRTRR